MIFLCILSLGIYELLLVSGNAFKLGPNIAFQALLASIYPEGNQNPLIRLLLVELSWIIRCLPYIFIAMLLNYPSLRESVIKPSKGKNNNIISSLFGN